VESRLSVQMMLFLQLFCFGECTGISFVDSTCVPVCHNKRIHNNKVFNGYAEREKMPDGDATSLQAAQTIATTAICKREYQ
jgi:hypothetical protein